MEPLSIAELETFELLRHVRTESLERLQLRAELQAVAPGEALLEAGRSNTTLYLVRSGSFEVRLDSAESRAIAVISRGESIGELSVLDHKPTSAHVIAREVSVVLAVPEEEVWNLLEHSHSFAVNLLLKLGDRLRTQNRTISAQIQRREEAFEHAARYDPLTGIHNRSWLDAALPRWIERHASTGAPLSLILADVDHFKLYNDNYGHRVGDAVLTAAARALQRVLRQGDRVARYGGDEFVVLLPETDMRRACATAERLRESLRQASPSAADPPITLSMGIAQLRADQDAGTLVDAADSALYAAKAAGRDTVRWRS